MRYTFLSLAALCLSSICVAVNAQIVVDQSQLDNNTVIAGFRQEDLAQSFQQANNNITGANIRLASGFGSGLGDVTIDLYNNLPNVGGTLLASGTATGVGVGELATVNYGQISLTPNSTYYLVFTSTNTSLGIGGSDSNPYPRGQVYANGGFQPFPLSDYAFQTFANVTPAAVPEPGSIALLVGAGVGGLMLRRRNRK